MTVKVGDKILIYWSRNSSIIGNTYPVTEIGLDGGFEVGLIDFDGWFAYNNKYNNGSKYVLLTNLAELLYTGAKND